MNNGAKKVPTQIGEIRKLTQRVRKAPRDVIARISVLFNSGYSTAEIAGLIAKENPEGSVRLRTVQNYVKEIRDNGLPWDRMAMSGEDARNVLDVLAFVVRFSNGRKRSFSDDEAKWVAWVYRAAPGLSAYRIWVLASLYVAEVRKDAPDMSPMDEYIAFQPWVSHENETTYLETVALADRIDFRIEASGSARIRLSETDEAAPLEELEPDLATGKITAGVK